ncbi:MAG: 16S rRNA (uracil(1498)-N(3))-methyltransferase [Desulfobacteraceae bacterium]|jgi:16S rRNA (uracil1498-N3)-methyltransferase
MAVRRFFVEEIEAKDGLCTIRGSEAKHMTRVLRMGPGDRFILMDGKGARFQAVIESAGRRELLVSLEKPLPQLPPSHIEITLCQALLKSRAMDYVIEKTSELGVHRILPFSSERTVVRLNKERFANKKQHWREIARGAAKQSDRKTPVEIGPLSSFEELVGMCRAENALKIILWEEEEARDLKGVLRGSPPFTPTRPSPSRGRVREGVKNFVGIVGPEGGFSREEVRAAGEAGFVSVSLGQRVLRAETAAITMVAIVQYERGDLTLSHLTKPASGS